MPINSDSPGKHPYFEDPTSKVSFLYGIHVNFILGEESVFLGIFQ